MKSLFLSLNILIFSAPIFSFDEDVLKEIQNINTTKERSCSHGPINLKIKDGKVILTDSRNLLGKYKQYNIYDESANFILADHLTTNNLDYAANNFFPELVIFKNKDKVLLFEGLSFKIQKNGLNENCKGKNINNLHCYSKGYNTNISSFKKKIVLAFQNKKIRDLASAEFSEMNFPYDQFDFHSSNVRIGNNGSVKRSVALINVGDIVNFTYSYPQTKYVMSECDLKL